MNVRVPVAFCAGRVLGFKTSPHTILVKAVFFHSIGLDAKVINLPLASCRGGVAGGFEHTRKSNIVPRVKMTAGPPARHVPVIDPTVPKRVLPGQKRYAGGGALGHRVGIGKLHPLFCQLVEVGRLHFLSAVAAEPFGPKVVSHNKDDVRLL